MVACGYGRLRAVTGGYRWLRAVTCGHILWQVGECAKICMKHRAALRLVSEAWRKTRFERIALHGQLQDALARENTEQKRFQVNQRLRNGYVTVT